MQAQTSQTDKGDQAPSARSEHATDHSAVVDQKQIAKSTKCTFSGVVRVMGSCGPSSHDKRKTTTPNTGQRWAKGEPDWNVIGGKAGQPEVMVTVLAELATSMS